MKNEVTKKFLNITKNGIKSRKKCTRKRKKTKKKSQAFKKKDKKRKREVNQEDGQKRVYILYDTFKTLYKKHIKKWETKVLNVK